LVWLRAALFPIPQRPEGNMITRRECLLGQAERPPQVFTAVRIRHIVTGLGVDPAAVAQAIQLSEEKYCSVGAMVAKSAKLETTSEIREDETAWLKAETAEVRVSG